MVPHRTKHEFRGMMGSDENTPFYQKKIHQVRLRTRLEFWFSKEPGRHHPVPENNINGRIKE
eukprot:scaffold44_cov135-Skeletonema_marinoi.AAC.4